MRFFKPKPPIKPDEYEWILACFAWLRSVLDDQHIKPPLVLPSDPALLDARTGPELFEAVKKLAGMDDWPCRLEKIEEDARPQHDARIVTVTDGGAQGTFSVEGNEPVIRYSAAMLRNPDALAATFAHELCHYLLANAGDPPGGPDLMEHSTDCAAAYLGFGVLLANSSRTFQQWTDGEWFGWSASNSGYLSEQALVTATAMFCALHGYDWQDAIPSLKPYLRSDLKKAAKAIDRDFPDIGNVLDEFDLLEWSFA